MTQFSTLKEGLKIMLKENEDKNSAIPSTNDAPKRSQGVDAAPSFTPGPCTVLESRVPGYERQIAVVGEANLGVCRITGAGSSNPKVLDRARADGRLHAAAPALYEALQATPCLKADFEGDTCKFWNSNYGQELCQRCAALALATDNAPAQDLGHNNDRKQ